MVCEASHAANRFSNSRFTMERLRHFLPGAEDDVPWRDNLYPNGSVPTPSVDGHLLHHSHTQCFVPPGTSDSSILPSAVVWTALDSFNLHPIKRAQQLDDLVNLLFTLIGFSINVNRYHFVGIVLVFCRRDERRFREFSRFGICHRRGYRGGGHDADCQIVG